MPRIRLVRVAVASAPEDLSICDIAGRRLRLKARGSKFQLRCVVARASRPCEYRLNTRLGAEPVETCWLLAQTTNPRASGFDNGRCGIGAGRRFPRPLQSSLRTRGRTRLLRRSV